MRIAIVAVGKVKGRELRAVLDDYYGRIRRYAKFEEKELKDASASEVRDRMARAIDARGKTVALEVEGEPWSSHRLADFVRRCEDTSVPVASFVIGGAYGLPPEISQAADVRLSLSAMTLPHRLARVVLAEQIYRAFTILRGEPYSH